MITAIRHFLEVSRCGNFTRAAWELNLTPSILTKKIKQLEEKLGYKLFYRTTRKVNLTPEGQLFLKKAAALVGNYDHLFDPIDPKNLAPTIKIATSHFLAAVFIIKHIPEFSFKYPKIKFEFLPHCTPSDIMEGRVDIALGPMNDDIGTLSKTILFKSKRHLFAAPSYIEQFGTPKTPEDLKDHHCLINLTAHPDKKWLFKDQEISIEPKVAAYESSILVDAALQGIGIINSPTETLLNYLSSGQLIPLKIALYEECIYINLVHQKVPKEHILRQFTDFINHKSRKLLHTVK